MPKKFLNFSFSKNVFSAFALLLNAFVWFYMTITIIGRILETNKIATDETFIIWTVYYSTIIISGFLGSIISSRIDRFKIIFSWIILGVIVSPLPFLLVNSFSLINMLIIVILFGSILGIGMPSCLAYFADQTEIENRGKISGITLLLTNLIGAFFLISFESFDLNMNLLLLIIWRLTAGVIFFLNRDKNIIFETKKNPSLISVIKDKSFLLFFIAWIMFCLIDRFQTPIQRNFLGEVLYGKIVIVGQLLGSIAAVFGGFFADRVGRKKILIYTFVAMGVAYAINGIFTVEVESYILSLGVLSVSAGLIWVLFILVLWGDLATFFTSEKYYAIGITPFFLTNIIQQFSANNFSKFPVNGAFSLAAFFLFLAVIPLLYAPETLPQKKIELRRLRKFADDAKRIREKYENKNLA